MRVVPSTPRSFAVASKVERTTDRKCKRLFIGGHGAGDSVGVYDLFYLYPRNPQPASLREWQTRLARLPEVDPRETRRRARAMIFDPNGPCYVGPLGVPDIAEKRSPTEAERQTFHQLLDCLDSLMDRTSPEHSVVFSACGPLDEESIARNRVGDTGLGQEVCGRLFADAMATRVFYSRGACGTGVTTNVYDTSPFGHRVVAPSNWAEIRPR